MAMNDADVIILMTDVADGITPADTIAAQRLRTTEKPVILAVNKVDNDNREFNIPEFYELGMGDPTPVSAYHNYGIHDLMERVLGCLPGFTLTPTLSLEGEGELEEVEEFPESLEDVPPQAELNLSIVGRTNVGKSALLNAILGQERSIVSPIAGTTRDALDTQFSYRGREVVVVDTAGMRRPGQVERGIEKYSVIRAVGAVDRCDISLIVVDASELATAQDTHIAGLAWEMGRGVIVVVNKWDLREEQGRYARAEAEAIVRERLHFMSYVPVCFTLRAARPGHRRPDGHGNGALGRAPPPGGKPRLAVHAGRRHVRAQSASGEAEPRGSGAHQPGAPGRDKPADVSVYGQ